MNKLDELWSDLAQADSMGDTELAMKIMARIREEEANPSKEPILPPGMNPNDPRSYIAEGISNIPSSLMGVGEDLVGGVKAFVEDPIGVGKGALEAAGAGFEKVGRNFEEFYTGEEIAPTPGKEDAIEPLIQGAKDRYGSPEAILRTAVTDPAGMALDVSPLAGTRGIKALEPLGVAGRTASKVTPNAPNTDVMRARGVGVPRSELPEVKERVGRTVAEEGLDVSEQGLATARKITDDLSNDLDDLVSNATSNAATAVHGKPLATLIPRGEVIKTLDGYMKRLENTFNAGENIAKINKMKNTFLNDYKGRKHLTVEEVHKLKIDLYDKVYDRTFGSKRDKAKGTKTEGMREVARGAKEAVGKRVKDYNKTNQRWANVKEATGYIENKIDQLEQMTGPDASILSMVRSTIAKPQARLKIANAIDYFNSMPITEAMKWAEKNLNSAEMRTVLALTGRSQDDPLKIEIQDGIPQ